MAEECIHGLELSLCDICSPQHKPEVIHPAVGSRPRDIRPPSRPRTSSPPRTGSRASRVPAPASRPSPTRPLDVGRQRMFHLTHLSNLEAILRDGAVRAGVAPNVDISAPDTRAARRTALVGGEGSAAVSSFVPFFLAPDPKVWRDIRDQVVDPRLSADSRRYEPAEFIMLVTTVDAAGPDVVFADGDAADPATRFAAGAESRERMMRRLLADDDALDASEALVPDAVPFELISLIGVAHDPARDAVREVLLRATFEPRVAVHPPWFARSES